MRELQLSPLISALAALLYPFLHISLSQQSLPPATINRRTPHVYRPRASLRPHRAGPTTPCRCEAMQAAGSSSSASARRAAACGASITTTTSATSPTTARTSNRAGSSARRVLTHATGLAGGGGGGGGDVVKEARRKLGYKNRWCVSVACVLTVMLDDGGCWWQCERAPHAPPTPLARPPSAPHATRAGTGTTSRPAK